MKIYTKAGDAGCTRLVGGAKVTKHNQRIETYGGLDELNSGLGVALSFMEGENLSALPKDLVHIQNLLFNLGSLLACEDEKWISQMPHVEESDITFLENKIDEMTASLKPLKNFILPGGHKAATHLHLSRTVARRCERQAVGLLDYMLKTQLGLSIETWNPHADLDALKNTQASAVAEVQVLLLSIRYLNRLSDYLFTAARFVNAKSEIPDQEWQK